MTTVLQQQLAQIAAKSTHQLDLKAQKAQHAKSLLFEPADAARQSFDDIFLLCTEGFEELCQLDLRFSTFRNNLFSDGSKGVDRGELTQHENEELNRVLEQCLGLLQARLLLAPAQKTLEWLVRRWRVHEHNTEALVLTFLPYHADQHLLPALLAILPTDRTLPDSLKWLHPYLSSLACPPRHAVLAAATSNSAFFVAFNAYVLRLARAGHASSSLLAYWASLVAQSINAMLDASRTGRQDLRAQREEQILLKVLSVIQDALQISKKPDMDEIFVAACMIITVLASKASLSDVTIDALMQAVARSWTTRTTLEGLSCLATLAEEKEDAQLPKSITRSILHAAAFPHLLQLASSQRVDKLAAGISVGILRSASKIEEPAHLEVVLRTLDERFLSSEQTLRVLEAIFGAVQDCKDQSTSNLLVDILRRLGEADDSRRLIIEAARNQGTELQGAGLVDLLEASPTGPTTQTESVELDERMEIEEQASHTVDLSKIVDELPPLPSSHFSFLKWNGAPASLFQLYSRAFEASMPSQSATEQFLDRSQLRHPGSTTTPTLFSFLARLWTTQSSSVNPKARVRALQIIKSQIDGRIKDNSAHTSDISVPGLDLRDFFPYLIAAFCDPSKRVRLAAAMLFESLTRESKLVQGNDESTPAGQLYDAKRTDDHVRLSNANCNSLLQSIGQAVEDCMLDETYLITFTAKLFNGHKVKGLSKAQRPVICEFLAYHAARTASLHTKLCLLRILAKVDKDAASARLHHLVPFLKDWLSQSEADLSGACERDGVRLWELDAALLENLWHCSGQDMKVVRDLCMQSQRRGIAEAAFTQQQRAWATVKSAEKQREVVDWLVTLALGEAPSSANVSDMALQTLHALEIPSTVFEGILQELPNISDVQAHPPAAKRQRRTSESVQARSIDPEWVQNTIRKITLILELLEESKPQAPELLQPLFYLLSELRGLKLASSSELVYLHAMILDALLAIVSHQDDWSKANTSLDASYIRTDLIIECLRSSSSTQVHNTALLLISALAGWAPESVLHSVMPLFTFMSTTILQKSDSYSAHVIEQTIAKIVPALATSLKEKGKNILSGVSEMLLSFVAAWEHVPRHRRLDLFATVVNAVEPLDCLGAVSAMLVERYEQGEPFVYSFIEDLICQYQGIEIMTAARQWLNLLSDSTKAPEPKKRTAARTCDILLSMSEKDANEKATVVESLLSALASLLRRGPVQNTVATSLSKATQEEAQQIRSHYVSLLELAIDISQQVDTFTDQGEQVVSAVLRLLPNADFIASSAEVMQTGSDVSREKVFLCLESRVLDSKQGSHESQIFMDLLPGCAAFIRKDRNVAVRAAAIACMDVICEKFGKTDLRMVRDAAETIVGDAALGDDDEKLKALSLLCLASMAGALSNVDEALSVLPRILTATLDLLVRNAEHGTPSEVDSAAFRLLSSLLDHIPWILTSSSKELDRAFQVASRMDADDAINDFLSLAAKKTPVPELFASIERLWNEEGLPPGASTSGNAASIVGRLTRVLDQSVQNSTKASITKNASIVFRVLLRGLDLAANAIRPSDTDALNNAALNVTLKMNDATFRPFFIQLTEWATSGHANVAVQTQRLTTLYSFALILFNRLGSLVTMYTGYLLESAHDLLGRSTTDEGLTLTILETLRSSFRNDEDEFWTASAHFDPIAEPLVNLLERGQGDKAQAAAASQDRLKFISGKLLSLLRHERANVRLSAIQCQRGITAEITFDWLAMLPEMLPVISELQEDDDERVEREALAWIRQIEEISGESLEGMLA
ncbi:armadillo-type protein [Neohortaea acidophila]|uniref:U3 small nucleolar RNA-associated protein 10 n=1 Tax=Neohortaea acidophila TaxID=245834 RepID=A0A6A6PNU6_9PEZI|nr:armadillo-type protein [Neohortaea acidophila]KAF2480937.1 armadillo-type protein [Neohortaea acidophila]